MRKKSILPIFILIFALFLSSCSSPVTYSVDKEHKSKMEVINNMIEGLLEGDSSLYLSVFEPTYIENVKKVVDTLGLQYYDAESFDGLMKNFFTQTKAGFDANYGSKIKVALSFNSVEKGVLEETGAFLDEYSVGYKFPTDDIKNVYKLSVKMNISSSNYSGETNNQFTMFEMTNGKYYLHPESFLYSF